MKILDRIKVINGTNIGKVGTILHKGPNIQQGGVVEDKDNPPKLLKSFWILTDDGHKINVPEDQLELFG